MTAWVISAALSVGLALLAGWAVPAWAMKRLLPVLEGSGHLVTNYRGRRIPTGLGVVWIVWAAAVALVAALTTAALYLIQGSLSADAVRVAASLPLRIVSMMPLLLVVGAFAFGFVDDVFGAGGVKGFRGHLRELRHGRITTGGLKLLGIGLLAVFAATDTPAFYDPLRMIPQAGWGLRPLTALAGWACATLVIALSANLVNLTDLRPGRAIKTYGLLAVVGVGLALVRLLANVSPDAAPAGLVFLAPADAWIAAICLAVLLIGPVLAIGGHDLGERAMLGDAGANAMGALAGFVIAAVAPLWLLAGFVVVLLALNLASERVSFSRVIERVSVLRWIDGLGRLAAEPDVTAQRQDGDDGTRTGGSAAEGDDA